MGNAGSTGMQQRERQKSTDLSTPNSPYREIGAGVSGNAASGGGSGSGGSGSSGSGTAGVVVGQVFSFDKRGRELVLQGGSSQEDEETVSEPYYTKPIGIKTSGVMTTTNTTKATTTIASTMSNTTGSVTLIDTEFDAPVTRKRSLTISEGHSARTEGQGEHRDDDLDAQDEKNESISSSEKMNIKEESKNGNRHPALPTVLRWDGGGKNVMISGTFSKWKPIPMVRSHGNFVTIIDLPEGDHQYKFYVDGEWKHDPKLVS